MRQRSPELAFRFFLPSIARRQPVRRRSSKAFKYLALYEIETDDIAATVKELRARGGTADIVPSSDAIDMKTVATYMFTPIKEKVMAKDVKRPRRAA